MSQKIRFVVATRTSAQDFFTQTATGRSLAFYNPSNVELMLYADNRAGLSKVYNMALDEARADPSVMIFAHDDLHLIDFYWLDKVYQALEVFDIGGLAGNKTRVPAQPSWLFPDTSFKIGNLADLSGIVAHGRQFPPSNLSVYGAPRQQVKLLDGLMLFAHSETLVRNDLRFDERFDFHFYDLDFCREAEKRGMTLGTWDISVIHESMGNLSSASWNTGYATYLDKWGD